MITGGLEDWTCICLLIANICMGSVTNLLAVDAGASIDFAVVPFKDDELLITTAAAPATASASFLTPVSDDDC